MKAYKELSKLELQKELEIVEAEYAKILDAHYQINMSRGQPCTDQLDLSMELLDKVNSKTNLISNGVDYRNYGILDGINEAKALFSEIMEVPKENLIILGNSSLNAMFDQVNRSFVKGVMGNTPWCKLDKVKWLCPVPGYDRHFAINEYFGIEMINIPMLPTGPDMDMVERLVAEDESIKGIWCVPKYANPSGITYSPETVKRFANLKPLAKDFRIYWDNAYAMHHLYDDNQDYIEEIVSSCAKAGNPDLVYKFTSTSKMTFPGSGIAAIATSTANIADIKKLMSKQTIGYDKINELRHALYFPNLDSVKAQMQKHANILRPKFELVLDILDKNLSGLDIANWTKPHGGYFVCFDGLNGSAKEIVRLCKEAGITLTDAGATYPYHLDPNDTNIRLAPSNPPLHELKIACNVFCTVVKLVSIKLIMTQK